MAAAAAVFREVGFERASMSEIAVRLGGSKATLYGYFSSKEQLFLAVTNAEAAAYFEPVMSELSGDGDDIAHALRRFGEKAMSFVLRPSAIASRRMVLAVAGQSDIARSYYASGPEKGLKFIESYLRRSLARGALDAGDPWVMAQHFAALIEAELVPERLYGVKTNIPDESEIQAAVQRAVDVFLTAYRR